MFRDNHHAAIRMDDLSKKNVKTINEHNFIKINKTLGAIVQKEIKSRDLNRNEAAKFLSEECNISFANAYIRLLRLHVNPYNMTIRTICSVLELFGYELTIRKK